MVINKRLEINGPALVFITTTVIDWIPIFNSKEFAMEILKQLDETAKYFKASIIGYVIMPSHIHFLLGLSDYGELSEFMKAFKGITSRKLKNSVIEWYGNKFTNDGKFQLWKRRFDDVIIYSEDQFKIKLDYIHNNPVREGLVSDPVDWTYSSASDWLSGKAGIIKIDKDYSWFNLG